MTTANRDFLSDEKGYLPAQREHFTTGYIIDAFSKLLDQADENIKNFINAHTGITGADGTFLPSLNGTGTLTLSASDSLQLQQLMADQSIAAQTGTSTLKTVKDSIMGSARNI